VIGNPDRVVLYLPRCGRLSLPRSDHEVLDHAETVVAKRDTIDVSSAFVRSRSRPYPHCQLLSDRRSPHTVTQPFTATLSPSTSIGKKRSPRLKRGGDVLREPECDTLQGYAFARPMPADALQKFMQAQTWRAVA
jgi:hypothetical protein